MIDKIRKQEAKIAVVGDLMIDHYIWGDCKRISPEAPVQVVSTTKENSLLGGAGNVINNLQSLDAKMCIFSVIGEDISAKEIRSLLEKTEPCNIYLVEEKNRATTKKTRIIASNQQIIRYDNETTNDISQTSEQLLLQEIEKNFTSYDVILLSDYGKGVLTPSLTQNIISLAKKFNKPLLVDPKGVDYSKYKGATLLTPNKKEAQEATNIIINSKQTLKEAGFKLKKELNLESMVITLSEEGMGIFEEELKIIPTVAREVYDVTGAGDTVLASLGVALASKLTLIEASIFANKAAAVVVAKVGSATVTLNEIEEYEHSLNKGQCESKIKDFIEIKRIAQRLKSQKRKIIFTNGCFDILHRGHASYLEKAKALGDILILGVNSDQSIKRLKGQNRPINPLEDRAFLLSALESVDFVVPFKEDTPYELIKEITPHILVKGADYKGKEVVGSDIADEVVLIEFVEGKSTTNLIKKIEGQIC